MPCWQKDNGVNLVNRNETSFWPLQCICKTWNNFLQHFIKTNSQTITEFATGHLSKEAIPHFKTGHNSLISMRSKTAFHVNCSQLNLLTSVYPVICIMCVRLFRLQRNFSFLTTGTGVDAWFIGWRIFIYVWFALYSIFDKFFKMFSYNFK